MTSIRHGIDLVDCPRIEAMLERHDKRFLERVYTGREREYADKGKNRIERLAGRFACKEAVLKLLGTGWRGKIAWTDIEIVNDELGKPHVNLGGHVAEIADEQGIHEIAISITHTANFVIASAVASAEPKDT